MLQCHGAADEALASASTTLKGLLTLPAQAAQVAYHKLLLSTQNLCPHCLRLHFVLMSLSMTLFLACGCMRQSLRQEACGIQLIP